MTLLNATAFLFLLINRFHCGEYERAPKAKEKYLTLTCFFRDFSYSFQLPHFYTLKIILPQITFSGYIIPLKWSKKWPKTKS